MKMEKGETKFFHIWGYGLVVLWGTFVVIVFIGQIFETWPNIFIAFARTISSVILISLFAVPIAAMMTLAIGGFAWLVFKQIDLPNSLRATLSGGLAGSLVFLPILITELSNNQTNGQIGMLYFLLGLGALGLWSGWLGERLARRHVRIDPGKIADSFD